MPQRHRPKQNDPDRALTAADYATIYYSGLAWRAQQAETAQLALETTKEQPPEVETHRLETLEAIASSASLGPNTI